MTQSPLIIEADSVCKRYQRGKIEVPALRGVSLSVAPGAFVMITGESGSGKSTLLNLCGCLDVPDQGSLKLFGQEVKSLNDRERSTLRKQKIGFIFQDFHLIPVLSALENVAYALEIRKLPRSRTRAIELLELVGLKDKVNAQVNALSGGQMQRVAIARALAGNPALMIADEPTANLDSHNKELVLNLLKELSTTLEVAVLLVTHDQTLAAWADRVVYLNDGVIQQCAQRYV